ARESTDTLYRLELEVCQVESGRVESLARDLDPSSEQQASDQVAEMLALLLRPEGIGDADVPWKSGAARKSKPKPAPPAGPATMASPPAPAPRSFEEPEDLVEHDYGEGHPFAIGASIGMTSAFDKPTDSRGSSLGMPV